MSKLLSEEYQRFCSGGFRSPSKDRGFELFCKVKDLQKENEALKKENDGLKKVIESLEVNLMLMLASYGDNTRTEKLIRDSLTVIKGEGK